MKSVLISVLAMLQGAARSRVALHLDVLALRHQLQVLKRSDRNGGALAKVHVGLTPHPTTASARLWYASMSNMIGQLESSASDATLAIGR